MHGPNMHPVERLLHRLADSISRHRNWYIYPQLALFCLCLVFAGMFLEFKTGRNDLVSADASYQQRQLKLKEEFQVQEDLVTVVQSDDLEKNRQFVERLGACLEAETNLFKNVFYKGDLLTMGPKALLFLPEDRLHEMLKALSDYGPLIHQFSEVTNLNSLFAEVNAQMRAAKPEEVATLPLTKSVTALNRIVDQAIDSLKRPGVPPSPGLASLFVTNPKSNPGEFISFAGGEFFAVTCAARNENLEDAAIVRLRQLVHKIQDEVPGVNVGVTGEPVLRFDEMKQAQADTTLASMVSLAAISVIFILGYREIRRPLKAVACLIVGIGYTVGFTTLTIGHLNLLTITFVPILIGLAIDFGVHLITRFEEELRRGSPERYALEKALVATGTGICTCGFTAAVAFLAMSLAGFKAMREMGIISGGGLLLCLAAMLTLLPAILITGREGPARTRPDTKRRGWRRQKFEKFCLSRPRMVVGVCAALFLLSCAALNHLTFDYNLLDLQSQKLPAVEYGKILMRYSPRSLLSCSVVADTLPQALELEQRIRHLRSVAAVDSVAPLLAEQDRGKLDLVQQITSEAAAAQFAPMDGSPVDLTNLNQTLSSFDQTLRGAVYFLNNAPQSPDVPSLLEQVRSLRDSVEQWQNAISAGPPETVAKKMTLYQQAFFSDLAKTTAALKKQEYHEGLRPQDLPPGLRSRFIGRTGKYLLQVYPKKNVWQRANQKEFVSDLRSVAPDVTGSPVQFYEFTNMLKRNFLRSAFYALVAISLMLMLHFRNATCVLLILMPVVVGIVWTIGMMVPLGIAFNPANIVSLTLLIGIGVSNGIHILNRFTEEKHPSLLAKSTGKAVLVSALNTIAGFGSLTLAKHHGIASLGQVMAIGTGMCMLAALTLMPAVLMLLSQSGWKPSHGWFAKGSALSKHVRHIAKGNE